MPAHRTPTRKDWVETGVYVGLYMAAALIAGIFLGRRPLFYLALIAAGLALLVRWHAGAFAYRCPHCGFEFAISPWRDFAGPQMLAAKYLSCPNCRRRGWAKVLKKF